MTIVSASARPPPAPHAIHSVGGELPCVVKTPGAAVRRYAALELKVLARHRAAFQCAETSRRNQRIVAGSPA